jgi:Zn-dependent peptidase ImmA (M78 family)/DNA-binding XRE family transcriptional regulator
MVSEKIVQFPAAHSNATGRRLIPDRLRAARVVKMLNQRELADLVGVSRQAISAFEQGDKSPDVETAYRIAKALEQEISYFVASDLPRFGSFSARFLRAFGQDTIKRNLMCDVLGDWFVQTVKYLDGHLNFPPLILPEAMPQAPSGRYAEEEIEKAAEDCRKAWGLGPGPISNILSLIENKGISVCRVEAPGAKIEAFSFWSGSRPFIFLSSDKDSAVRARFDAAHELGHLILHRGVGVDELENPKTLKVIESEANRFAGAFLLPRSTFPNEVFTARLDAFIDLKRRWKVAIQAMIYRCKDLGVIDEDLFINLYKQMSKRKWRTREPLDDELPLEQPRLLRQATDLLIHHHRRHPDQILTEVNLSRTILSRILNVAEDTFDAEVPKDVPPTLK